MTARTADTDLSASATPRRLPPGGIAALVVLAGSVALLLGAVFFEHVLKIPPCPLCFEQRIPHYIAVPLALALVLAARFRVPRGLVALGLAVLTVALLVTAGIGGYHAGVEWGLWAGPTDCTGDIGDFGRAGNLLDSLQTTTVVRCDVVLWRFFGLSLAGWNAVLSTALALVAGVGFVATVRRSA